MTVLIKVLGLDVIVMTVVGCGFRVPSGDFHLFVAERFEA